MKLFRYRKPSLKRLTGLTAIKRRVKHSLGLSQVEGLVKPSRIKQHLKQKIGLYSPESQVVRNTAKGRYPSFLGLFGKRKE